MKIVKILYAIILGHFFVFSSCEIDNSSNLSGDNFEKADETLISNEPIMKSNEAKLFDFLDSAEFIGQYDVGYELFLKTFNCDQSDSIIDYTEDGKLALYAFYSISFGNDSCKLTTLEAMNLIEKMVRFSDTIGVWTWVDMRGKYLPAQAAANSIWENYKFPLNDEQKKQVAKYRNM
jgi:hypothetical protein